MKTVYAGILRTASVAPPLKPVKPAALPATFKRVDLFNSMCNGTEITVMSKPDGKFHTGIVQKIEREDGSGYRFLIRLHNSQETLYVSMM